jgi:hypothetical protein
MQKGINQFLVFMTVFAVVVTSFITPTTAYADDGTTGGETSETPVVEEQEPAVEEAAPVETVEEIMEQIPEGTEVIVVNEEGEVEPLATEEAAQAIIEGDPMWCPDGVTPGDASCTIGFATFQELIDVLTTDNGTNYSGDGVIWVAGSYTNADNAAVVFDGSLLTALGNLEFIGGWSGANNTTVNAADLADLDVSLSIFNWTGDVSLSNLNINAQDNNAGLYVQTNGNITLNNITSSGNALGSGADLNTCLFNGAECTGTGNVSVDDSTFNGNTGGSGLIVDSGGTIDLDTVEAGSNGDAGALLYNHDLLGSGGVQVTDGLFNANGDNGIYVYGEDTITLTNTDATNNGFDGADLINYEGSGNVSVNGGDFSNNDDAGLYVDSAGDVTIASVVANDNNNGAIIFTEYGSGSVMVSGSVFNDNTWTGVQVTSSGNVTLDNVEASGNYVGGAYLNALSGPGSISVVNGSQFNGNGQYGLHAFAKGDITLSNVVVNGSGTYNTQAGAWLKSFEGNVSVTDSVFTNNLNYGLLAVAGGTVDLVNVTATFNGGDGVAVYSIYSFACFGNDNILINVDSGLYTDNGGYGIAAYPGELGSLTLNNSPVFAPNANALGDTFVELLSNPCPKDDKPPVEEGDGKDPNVVQVPEDGTSGPVEQDCELYSSTEFYLHSGTVVKVDCPFDGTGEVTDTPEVNLPDDLPVGLTFADAVTVALDSEGNPITVLDDGLITLTFKIPEELMGKRFSILYWDPTAKDGQGDWIELPFDQFGGAYFPLYPDNPDDGRLLCSGFKQSGDTVTVTVNFPGTFVLVAR